MAYIFFLIGILAVLFGGYITASMWSAGGVSGTQYGVVAALLGSLPGVGTIVSGLLFIAIGEVLVRLSNIDRQTDRAATAAERTAEYVERQ